MKDLKLTIEGKKIDLSYNEHFSNLAKINESLNKGAAQNYQKLGLTYVDVPEMVGITGACENIDTLFKIYNRFDLPLFFTQTGQLSLEQALQSFPGVFTVIHSGRDEEKEDQRHLRQFRLTEEEFGCTLAGMTRQNYDENKMFSALLLHIQHAVQSMVKEVLLGHKTTLQKTYKRDITKLMEATVKNFLRISYEEAIKLLNKNGYPDLKFGVDLKAQHEAKLVQLLNGKKSQLPVFITKYPKEIKFFNMKVSTDDPRVVLSADLIFPFAGEGTGSAVREHNFNSLNDRLLTSNMYKLHLKRGGKYEDFSWYLNIIKNKASNPHAGYGIGNERVLQYIFGESDIRNVSLFSLLNLQSGDWDKRRYGQAAIITSDKKQVLLSVGKEEDKKFLLSTIKKLVKKRNFILHSTDGTHKFLKNNGILTSKVHKISEIGKKPNIIDLLNRQTFDTIINIPSRGKPSRTDNREYTDGQLIRKGAINMGISLITDLEVAQMVIDNWVKN